MADLTLTLPPETAARLKREAEARGVSVEEVAVEAVEAWVTDDLDWEEDVRRLEEPGANVSLDDAFDRFDAKVSAARAAK